MKTPLIIIQLIILISISSSAQSYKFAWLSDIHIGQPAADVDLQNVVNDINKRNEIEFVILK